LEPTHRALQREWDNVERIVTDIRNAKAESLFGIGVKLSVIDDHRTSATRI